MANKTNLRKLAADAIRDSIESTDSIQLDVAPDATNPYAFVVTAKDHATGESKAFSVVVKPLADKAGE